MNVDTYKKNNKIAVLINSDFGAGWSTVNCKEIAIDKRIVEWILNHSYHKVRDNGDWALFGIDEDELEKYCDEIGYVNTYTGDASSLRITWIDKGTTFYIRNYDGVESIITSKDFITV